MDGTVYNPVVGINVAGLPKKKLSPILVPPAMGLFGNIVINDKPDMFVVTSTSNEDYIIVQGSGPGA